MSLSRIRTWICGGEETGTDEAIKTDSNITTSNTLQVDRVETESKVNVDVKTPKNLTLKHEVDVLGPAVTAISSSATALGNNLSQLKKSATTGAREFPNVMRLSLGNAFPKS